MKMFVLLTLAAASLATAASAASLTIDGSYGDAYGCKVAVQGTEDMQNRDWNDNWILVTPKRAEGHEWSCSFRSVRGSKINASCANAGDEKSSAQTITAIEQHSSGTLVWTDVGGTVTLHRCR